MPAQRHFALMARYNRWANRQLYGAVHALPEAHYRRDVGLFFTSLEGTLNHILLADRIWRCRIAGLAAPSQPLDTILFDSLDRLDAERELEDARLLADMDRLTEAELLRQVTYEREGRRHQHALDEVLAHLFSHQTHHRSQAHTGLIRLGVASPPSLDLCVMLRLDPASTS